MLSLDELLTVTKLFVPLEQKNEALFALLDAFGNVQTPMNHDATRYTLLFSLDFDAAGMMTCGLIQVNIANVALCELFCFDL